LRFLQSFVVGEGNRRFELIEHHRRFVILYNQYVHAIDDIIDEENKRNDPEFILNAFAIANELFSCKFYRDNAHILQPIEFMANNTYADSVAWEKSDEKWKQESARTLRHSGLDVFFAAFCICCGRDKLREISSDMREFTTKSQLNDIVQT